MLVALTTQAFLFSPQAFGAYASRSTAPSQTFGAHRESVEDMRIKVMGGSIRINRSWDKDAWYINRRWDPIQFVSTTSASDTTTSDGPPGPDKIYRAGNAYEWVSGSTWVHSTNPRLTITKTEIGWRWADRKGNWIEYNTDRFAMAYGDRNNVKVTLTYDTDNNIVGVFDHLEKQILWYEYNANNQISALRDDTNRRVEYTYDGATGRRITKAVDVLGNPWTYTYENTRLKTKTDPENRTTTFSGGATLTSITGPDGAITSFKYEYDKTKKEFYKQEKTPSGRMTETWYNKDGDIIRIAINGVDSEITQKDGQNRIETDAAGNKTINEYDQWNNRTKTLYPDNSSETWTYDATYSNVLTHANENGVTTKYAYDANGNLTKKTEAQGTPVQRITEYTYDAFGNKTSQKRLGDAVTQTAEKIYTYDDYGNVKTKTDPEGHVTQYTHDAQGKILIKTDARGNDWIQTYDAKGQLLTQSDPLGNTTTNTYDKVGNRLTETDPENATTTHVFDVNNRLVSITDALGGVTQFKLDAEGKLTQITDPEGRTITLGYDGEGRLIARTDGNSNTIGYDYNALGLRTTTTYPTYTEATQYDVRGRVVGTTLNTGTETLTTQTTYDQAGNELTTTDTAGRITSYVYDAHNRLTRTIDPASGVNAYAYDKRNNQISVTDAKGNIHKFEYDRNNNRTKEIRPMGQAITYAYDSNGNRIEQVDARGQRITMTFDAANRATLQDHYPTATATTPTDTITYSYNKNDLPTEYTSNGVSTVLAYDAVNRKTGETINYGPITKSYGYTYYKNGNKQSFTDPAGTIYSYAYDNANQLSSITIPGEGAITINSRQWVVPTKVTLPGGSTRHWTYDGLLRPTQISTKDPASNLLMDYQYTYDTAGNITEKQTEHGAYLYQYDTLDRLTAADNPELADEAYTYDEVGNRLSSTDASNWQYNANNQLTTYGNTALAYDANGNTISKTLNGTLTEQYTYDINNRLTEVKDSSNTTTATYTYDAYNRRISKTANGQTIYYMYSDEGLIAEFDATGNLIRKYGYQPDGTWSTDPIFTTDAGGYHYYQTDHLGTPQKLISKTGVTTWAAQYQAFGEANVTTQTVSNNFRFPGQYNDSETGLHYNWNRYYNNQAGRYVTSDPIGLKGGLNTYVYVENNPLIYMDTTGENPAIARAIIIVYTAARALARQIAKQCKRIRCKKIKIHGPHHRFPWGTKHCHVQLNCWIDKKKGSKFVIRVAFPCRWRR